MSWLVFKVTTDCICRRTWAEALLWAIIRCGPPLATCAPPHSFQFYQVQQYIFIIWNQQKRGCHTDSTILCLHHCFVLNMFLRSYWRRFISWSSAFWIESHAPYQTRYVTHKNVELLLPCCFESYINRHWLSLWWLQTSEFFNQIDAAAEQGFDCTSALDEVAKADEGS